MIDCDLHTHSAYSPDGKSALEEMVGAAKRKGLRYYGISEHFDYDFLSPLHFAAGGGPFCTTDPEAYFPAARKLQEEMRGKGFRMLVGAEFGYCPDPCVQARLAALFERYRPDHVINSVHIIDGCDVYFEDYFRGKSKREAYGLYLQRVFESLDAPYPYDIVGHIGYPSRNAPYPDRKLRYEDFPDLFDKILKTIVRKDKILEVNASAGDEPYFPPRDVLVRYRELGGELLSFGSDSHCAERLGADMGVAEDLKALGFRALTVPAPSGRLSLPL